MSSLERWVDLNAPKREQIEYSARRFDVRERVIVTILVNRGYLPQESITDQLEAA